MCSFFANAGQVKGGFGWAHLPIPPFTSLLMNFTFVNLEKKIIYYVAVIDSLG
jgi:hypothetical protein